MTPTTPLAPMPSERHAAVRALLVAEATPRDQPGRRSSPSPRRRLVTAIAAAAVVTASATAIVVAQSGSEPAFASWTAVPETAAAAEPAGADLERWASQCNDLAGAGVSIQGVAPDRKAAASRDVLVDRRGGYTYCLDVSPGSGTPTDPMVALAGIKGDDVQQSWGTAQDAPVPTPTGAHVVLLGGNLSDPPPAADDHQAFVESVYGTAGPGVTGVDIRVDGGTVVTATVHAGLWAGWWPSTVAGARIVGLVVHSAAGAEVVDPDTVSLH